MTLELAPEVCEVCDEGGTLTTYHGHRMHEGGASGPWRDDRKKRDAFYAEGKS